MYCTQEEMISLYKMQMEEYVKEFEGMRTSQQHLQEQIQELSMRNLQLRTENDRLGGQANDPNVGCIT